MVSEGLYANEAAVSKMMALKMMGFLNLKVKKMKMKRGMTTMLDAMMGVRRKVTKM